MSAVTASEETLRRLLAEFKVELVKELQAYATVASVEKVGREVELLKIWQATQLGSSTQRKMFSDRALAWAAVFVSIIGAVVTVIWLNHG